MKTEIIKFLKEHKTFLIQMSFMIVPAVCNANNITTDITPLQTPLTKIVSFVSGPLAGSATLISLVTGIASYGMGWEQSITKKAGAGVLCGASCTQIDSLTNALGITATSCTFF